MAVTIIAAYDITNDSRRARVAATLQIWGDRIQRSVFIATLDHDDLETLTAKIKDIIDTDDDSVYLFRQCATCWNAHDVHGQATTALPHLYWAAM